MRPICPPFVCIIIIACHHGPTARSHALHLLLFFGHSIQPNILFPLRISPPGRHSGVGLPPGPRCNSDSTLPLSCFVIYHQPCTLPHRAFQLSSVHDLLLAVSLRAASIIFDSSFDSPLHEKCVHPTPSTYDTSAPRDAFNDILLLTFCNFAFLSLVVYVLVHTVDVHSLLWYFFFSFIYHLTDN